MKQVSETVFKKVLCAAISVESGKPCKSRHLVDGTYCRFHSPEEPYVTARKTNAREAGSIAKGSLPLAKRLEVKDARGLYEYLGLILTSVAQQKSKPSDNYLKNLTALGKLFLEAEKQSTIIDKIEKIKDKIETK